jgi:hypothetical protein
MFWKVHRNLRKSQKNKLSVLLISINFSKNEWIIDKIVNRKWLWIDIESESERHKLKVYD